MWCGDSAMDSMVGGSDGCDFEDCSARRFGPGDTVGHVRVFVHWYLDIENINEEFHVFYWGFGPQA